MNAEASVQLQPGSTVRHLGERHEIVSLLNLEEVLARRLTDGESLRLKIAALEPDIEATASRRATRTGSLELIPTEAWSEAQRKFALIEPLLNAEGRARNSIREHSAAVGVSQSNFYRWLKEYDGNGFYGLLRLRRADRGATRLPEAVEAIINEVIRNEYLQPERPSVRDVHRTIERRCARRGLPIPHELTVRERIARVSQRERAVKREGKAAAQRFQPSGGQYPDGRFLLDIVQIDHFKIDLEIVDDTERLPIGRPWATLLICSWSRVVLGFHLSLRAPSIVSVGMAIAHAVLPKERFLERLGLTLPWPVWGKFGTLYADNGAEFRSGALERACAEHTINLQWRPPARPEYGAHIERLGGTLNSRLQRLPGTTFSSVAERGKDYKPEQRAVITFAALERILTREIIAYNNDLHSSLETTPIKRWEEGVHGTPLGTIPSVGLPDRLVGEPAKTLRLDFMPGKRPTVQRIGIEMLGEQYYDANVLARWAGARDELNPKQGRRFDVKYDPSDITQVYFFDPEFRTYMPVGYRDSTIPPGRTVWESKEVRASKRREGERAVNNELLYDVGDQNEAEVEHERKATKDHKRVRAQKQHKRNVQGANSTNPKPTPKTDADEAVAPAPTVEPFDSSEVDVEPVIIPKVVIRRS